VERGSATLSFSFWQPCVTTYHHPAGQFSKKLRKPKKTNTSLRPNLVCIAIKFVLQTKNQHHRQASY
jgi:hypothetical protein